MFCQEVGGRAALHACAVLALVAAAACGAGPEAKDSHESTETVSTPTPPNPVAVPITPAVAIAAPPLLPFDFTLPNDPNAIALTFDDGADDYGNTLAIAKTLIDAKVPATFFVNADNWSNILTDSVGKASILTIASHPELLTFGNHTDHHLHLPTLTPVQVHQEIDGLQAKVREVTNNPALRITQVRAPFGQPYQDASPNPTIVCEFAQYGVHVGWNVDPNDWGCGGWFPKQTVHPSDMQMAQSTTCVINGVNKALAAHPKGAGVILMHSNYPFTAAALAQLVKTLPAAGYHFVPVETFIKAKFGKTSDQITPYQGCKLPPGVPAGD